MKCTDEQDKTMGKREQLADRYSGDLLFADGYDDAIIGVAIGFDSERVIYDVEKMIDICSRDAVGAYVGKSTPVYMEKHNG